MAQSAGTGGFLGGFGIAAFLLGRKKTGKPPKAPPAAPAPAAAAAPS